VNPSDLGQILLLLLCYKLMDPGIISQAVG
jgi:hypothetical protein